MLATKRSAESLFLKFSLAFLFELLTFEFKEKIEYKRIKVLHRIFLKGCFCQGQGAHATV